MPAVAGYIGRTMRMPLNLAGFQFNRNTDLLIPTALIEPTININFHEGGIGKRGGSSLYWTTPLTGAPTIRGGYHFRKINGNSFILFGTSEGKLYHTNGDNLLKSSLSQSNPFHFSTFNDEAYICDGATVPQYWDGSGLIASVTPAASWSSEGVWPFQIIQHSQGANARNWAITKTDVWASKNQDGHDFGDATVIQIPISAEGGLVGGFDFGGVLFVFSKTKTYIVDDFDLDSVNWGYREALWEGGVASWRLIVKAGNNLILTTREGLIYNLAAVQATGDYTSVPLNRPAFIDRWIRENVSLTNIENCHATYDRKLRAIKFFFPVTTSNPNKGITYFIDRPPEIAWVLHDNEDYPSGYNAACSFEVENAIGDYQIWTGDNVGQIWKLEQSARSDNALSYKSQFTTKRLDMGNPRMWKRFSKARIRARAQGNFNLTVYWWVDGVRKTDRTLSMAGSGAMFDTAIFDSSVFVEDTIIPVEFPLGSYGYDIQFRVLNNNAGEDYFATELMVDFEPCGVR